MPAASLTRAGRPVRQRSGWPAITYSRSVWVSLSVSVTAIAVLFGWGAWQRRWISDDGLIVLRTVRNLLAGNGPVFNVGERVEANTSTVWTYLLTVGSWLAGPVRLEYVVLTFSLLLSVGGLLLFMLGTARLYAPGLRGRSAVLLPAGALVYIAVPPARDFATSGLESSLVLAYLGLLWWMMVRWSQSSQPTRPSQPIRLPRPPVAGRGFTLTLAVLAGASVLVRPELALIGGAALVMMLLAATDWRARAVIAVAGGLLPVAYQIFRMGYYGLLVPSTALAKDAAGDKWSQGMTYLENFNRPYALWAPGMLLAGLAVLVWVSAGRRRRIRRPATGSRVQTPRAVVVWMLVSGLLQAGYWIRQGGDFMHGRVLLVPLVCLLAPVAVIPIVLPDGVKSARAPGYLFASALGVLWLAVAGWALWAANSPGLGDDAIRVTHSGIVDERRFYAAATGHAHPLTAEDYLDYPRMRAAMIAIADTPGGALLLPAGNYDQWDVVPVLRPLPADPLPAPGPGGTGPHAIFFTNLGMSSMNVGLHVRVVDQIGLANPLAAHTERLRHGRIGHDKNLFVDWAIADGPWVKGFPGIPVYVDQLWVGQAEAALQCPATVAMLNSVRAPMGPRRFLSNLWHSYSFTGYRIDRVPLYELIRCGLPVPDSGSPPYTGLPATGP